jgi:hypothetical protein
VVDPRWPLLGMMLAGPWLAWPWFAFNGFAVGSPTRIREALVAGLGLLGSVALVFGIAAGIGTGVLAGTTLRLALLGLTLWKLGIGYVLYLIQARTFWVFEHYGGAVRNGLLVVLAGAFAEPSVGRLLGNPLLFLILR